MMNQFSRTALMLGNENMKALSISRIAVFGIGGVGGYCVEALVRSGIGAIDIFDNDRVCVTNLNRQVIATMKTIGMYKTDAMRERILDINPNIKVEAHKLFYMPETADRVDLSQYDYVIDAVDTMTAKLELVCRSSALKTPVISSMGTGNKLDPTLLEITDIFKTTICPMARIMRRELRKRGITSLKTVYSKEPPIQPFTDNSYCVQDTTHCRRQIPASNAFVPATAGLIIAGEVIRCLCK